MRPGPTLSLLFPSFAYHILSITARQYQTARHAISDTCAFIDTDLASVIGINRVDDDTNISIQSCLCLSTLSSFVRTDPQVHDAVLNFGEETISDALEHFVKSAVNSAQCTYPSHASPTCTQENACGFECSNGFSLSADASQCHCQYPNIVCNGRCGYFPSGCPYTRLSLSPSPSPSPHSNGRRSTLSILLASAEAQKSCKKGEAVCGVYGGHRLAYDCVDVSHNLESCGGCMLPSPFSDPSDPFQRGVDCSSLEGVSDIACISGKCVATKCLPGYQISQANNECVSAGDITLSTAHTLGNGHVSGLPLSAKSDSVHLSDLHVQLGSGPSISSNSKDQGASRNHSIPKYISL